MKQYKNFQTCPIDKVKCHFCVMEDNVLYCGRGVKVKVKGKQTIISELSKMVDMNIKCPLDTRARFSARWEQ